MAVRQSTLRDHASRTTLQKSMTIAEARVKGQQTAFLCHSHKDAELAKGVQGFLLAQGWSVYIDWLDTSMPDSPTKETSEKLQRKIRDSNWFLFLATANSMGSRWCPWELGYADGVKKYDDLLIIPTEANGAYYGNEYIKLYRHITDAEGGGYGAFRINNQGVKLTAMAPA